jgi:hypothetical protein
LLSKRTSEQEPAVAQIDRQMEEMAAAAGATLTVYPRPGPAVRSVVLQDEKDERGHLTMFAQIERDGTVRVMGHDKGKIVSDCWGKCFTSYEWIYTIAPEKVDGLIAALGGSPGDDLLTRSEVGAEFANWIS